jgi:uncharacterized protein (DUF433 family)
MAVREPKGDPFSIRLSESTDRLVASEARRTRRSKSAVVESLAEEAARLRRFPGVAFHGDTGVRIAWVVGTGLDVWEVIEMLEDFGSAERLVKESHLSAAQVRIAKAYHDAYPSEIDELVEQNRHSAEEWRDLYPFVETLG